MDDRLRSHLQAKTWLFVLPWEIHHAGGVNEVVRNLFDASAALLGRRPILLVNSWAAQNPEAACVDGRLTIRMSVRPPCDDKRAWRTLTLFLLTLPLSITRLRRLIIRQSIDCINIHYVGLTALVWALAIRTFAKRPKLILSFHGLDVADAVASRSYKRILWSSTLRLADSVVVCSPELQKDIADAFSLSEKRLLVIDNGIDPERLRAATQKPSRLEWPRKFILSLGTLEEKKGHDILLRAFDQLTAKHIDVQLVIAGRAADPAIVSSLHTLRRSLPSAERITILQDLTHSDAMHALAKSSLFVLASRREPFGIAILEAGALGIPVVASRACGVTRHLQNERELIVVPVDDVDQLALAMDRILGDEVLSNRFAVALRKRVLGDFTWRQVAPKYRALAPEEVSPGEAGGCGL